MSLVLFLLLSVVIVTMAFATSMRVTMSRVRTVLMKPLRFLEIVALAGNTEDTKGNHGQEKFHRATSITTRRPNAIPKVDFHGNQRATTPAARSCAPGSPSLEVVSAS